MQWLLRRYRRSVAGAFAQPKMKQTQTKIRRRERAIHVLPNEESLLRLVGAMRAKVARDPAGSDLPRYGRLSQVGRRTKPSGEGKTRAAQPPNLRELATMRHESVH